MINSISIKDENVYFKFKDKDISLLNSIRRTLISGIEVNILEVKDVVTNSENINHEKIKHLFSFIYINHKLFAKHDATSSKITFKLEYVCDDDYIQVFSDMINFYKGKKKIPTFIRKDLYLFTLRKDDLVSINGVISKKKRSLVGNFGIRVSGPTQFECHLNVLEMFTPFQVIMTGVIVLINELTRFKKEFTKNEITMPLGKHYKITTFDDTILNPLTVHINHSMEDDVILCGYNKPHYVVNEFLLRLYTDKSDQNELLLMACDNLIDKLEKVVKQIKTSIGKKKEFNTIIDTY